MKKFIFREYDIRAIYPDDLNNEDAYIIGKSFASYIDDKKVIIGHDNRLSSEEVNNNLIEGLLSSGANVIDLGLCTTPIYYYYKKLLNIKNGIMITASHNPKEYNGFKISFSYKGNACGKEIFDFKDFTLKGNFINEKGYSKRLQNNDNIIDMEYKDATLIGCGGTTGLIKLKEDNNNILYRNVEVNVLV